MPIPMQRTYGPTMPSILPRSRLDGGSRGTFNLMGDGSCLYHLGVTMSQGPLTIQPRVASLFLKGVTAPIL